MNELIALSARRAVQLLRNGDVTPAELIQASITRIEETNPSVNSLPILCIDRAYKQAKALSKAQRADRASEVGWLAGLPISIKDLNRVSGVRTTFGSPVFRNYEPEKSDIGVETLEQNGAITIGKSNVPELGPGGNTTNPLFGKTRNPWNTAMTCGGSSGGAAVSVATGQVWLANGSDGGCSLRVPASFCGITTLRPTPGRVPWGLNDDKAEGPRESPWEVLEVEGPLGRSVEDVALMFEAQIGAHPNDPRSFPSQAGSFLDAADSPRKPVRVAFSRDLGGLTPIAKEVGEICAQAVQRLAEMGVQVEEAFPDIAEARDAYRTLRAHTFVTAYGPLTTKYRDLIKPEIVWNVEEGAKLTSEQIARAEQQRASVYRKTASFFANYDLLICPTACTPPFDVNEFALMELEGHKFENYYDWYTSCFVISMTTCPSMSIPCGFTSHGLPVGLQLVAPRFGEKSLISAAKLLEEALGVSLNQPIDPRPAGK